MEIFEVEKIPAISAIFNESQLDNIHNPLVSKLIRIFKETEIDKFTSAFVTCLKIVLSAEGDVNVSVERVFEFASQFIIIVARLDAEDNTQVQDESFRFFYSIFNFFKQHHDVPSQIVRKRICQFISKLLLRMSPNAMLDCKICDIIINIMKERIKDKVPAIRLQAILAIHRLQDRTDKNCPVTKTLIECIETDTSAEVRRLAVSKISLVNRKLIEIIIDRTDDISEKVRKETYVVLSKLQVKVFSIEQRKRLLNTGLYDNNELVQNAVRNTLLPAWLKRMDYKFLDLLKALDLQVSSMEVTTKALMSLFHTTSHEIASETLKSLMDDINIIPFEKLTAESAFFWRCFVFFSSDLVSEKNNYNWESSKSYDATEKGLLPDLSVFCEYIKMYYTMTCTKLSEEKPWEKKEQEFILIQLVELCKVYDYADEVGRKELKVLCLALLKHVEMETIKPVVELYFMLQTNLNESISKITELINDLLYPNNPANAALKPEQNAVLNEKMNIDPIQEQNIKFKIAQLDVKMTELRDVQDEAIKSEDFVRAQELKSEISDVQDQIQKLKATLIEAEVTSSYQMMTDDDASEKSEEEEVGNRLDCLNADTVRRCLVILQEMLHLSLIKQLTPELRTLFQMLVLPACKSDNTSIATLATEVMGSCCLRDIALAKEYFTTVFALCGNSEICVSALKVIFDFLLCFGPSAFSINSFNEYENDVENKKKSHSHLDDSDESSTSMSDEDVSKNESSVAEQREVEEGFISGYTFISALVDLLDDEFVEARFTVVHGLCKLMATGKLKSSKVLTRLILIWFHPASKESIEIRDCLNFFFPFFVKHCPWALNLFENSFIPTMDTLFNAPIHNPLNTVDQKCVLKVLCDLTNPNFAHHDPLTGENIHYNVAILLCNHIMDLKDSNHQAILLKGLDYLDLSYIDPSMLPTVANLIARIMKKFKKKNLRKLLTDAKKIENKVLLLIKNRQRASSIANTVCLEKTEENCAVDEAEEL